MEGSLIDSDGPRRHREAGKTALDAVIDLLQAVGDRYSEALCRFNAAAVLQGMGRTGEAVSYTKRAAQLAEATGHPDLPQMRAFLDQLRQRPGSA